MSIPIADIQLALTENSALDLAFRAEPLTFPLPWMIAIRVGAGTIQVATSTTCHFWIDGNYSTGTLSSLRTLTSPVTIVIARVSLLTTLTSLGLHGSAVNTAEFNDAMVPRLTGLTSYTVTVGAAP